MSSLLDPPVPLFRPASDRLLRLMDRRIAKGALTFFSPIGRVSCEAAQAAYVLHSILNRPRSYVDRTDYRTFFGNSGVEAIHGAVKLIRHKRFAERFLSRPILIHDPFGALCDHFNPLSAPRGKELVPGLRFERDVGRLSATLREERAAAVFLRVDDTVSVDIAMGLARESKRVGATFVLDLSMATDLSLPTRVPCDIAVFGELLTDHMVPFGAFCATTEAYTPWNSVGTCLKHASTYGANGLALTVVIEVLMDMFALTPEESTGLEGITRHYRDTCRAFRRYVNPKAPDVYEFVANNVDVKSARGTRLYLSDGRELIDCISGAGCSLRGHNPTDVIEGVFRCHDSEHDYLGELCSLLYVHTGLAIGLPAVSGAHAVELAMTVALLARPDRTRIITFDGNFAGCTLVALNGTASAELTDPFRPLYHDVLIVDLEKPEASTLLERELLSGQVALVWLEVAPGAANPLPKEVLDIINRNKVNGGYLVGVDEVFSGFGRTGELTAYRGRIERPDLVAFSKALSDMLFPIAIAMVSDAVVQCARQTNRSAIDAMLVRYRNQLGSHISVHALRTFLEADGVERVRVMSERLRSGFERVLRETAAPVRFSGVGLNWCLEARSDNELSYILVVVYYFITMAAVFFRYAVRRRTSMSLLAECPACFMACRVGALGSAAHGI
jgi:acetylornithine/succinyldiaminopimelate/putrescine aminotransferase